MAKKILLLGGSHQQVVAIKMAKQMGYYTVLCDYLPDNPGRLVADVFYLESTTDKETILSIAMKEKIHGILAYASDPAAPTAAYVAEKMGLPTNPYESVLTLCNKDKFRLFLSQNGFCVPRANGYRTIQDAMDGLNCYEFPVVVKPVDSSGSKGVSVIYSHDEAASALDIAFQNSRSNRIIVEDYIEKKHKYLIGGDIFVVKGKIVIWGLLNCHRDQAANPLVPTGKSYPLDLDDNSIRKVKHTLQSLVDRLQIKQGAMNVELLIDKNECVYAIDVGPRNGGNMIPELLEYIFHVNIVELSIKAAMGDEIVLKTEDEQVFFATYNLHALEPGIFMGVEYSDLIKQYLIREELYKKTGDTIDFFNHAAHAIGIIFLRFHDKQKMFEILSGIDKEIKIITRRES